MSNIFDLFNPIHPTSVFNPMGYLSDSVRQPTMMTESDILTTSNTVDVMSKSATLNAERIVKKHMERVQDMLDKAKQLTQTLQTAQDITSNWTEYLRDATERGVLSLDTLRKRGDIFLSHQAEGCPPVLVYDYEVIVDGRDLKPACNYMLLHILPPEGTEIDDQLRPYIVIDPRAGHGPGIGGFKTDSQVGVALRAGHPVYFVAFRREPEPGQQIAHVTRAEAEFVREVMRRHPDAPKPVVIGNCQGGWATLLLAASHPDLTGPIVINGAPVSPWSGKVGENPMRYNAGVLGGTWVPMMLSDIGGGIFDGAHLVQNFELLNPGRTMLRKYTDLFRDIDHCENTFLDFEKWWGGYFLLNEPEIRWIVEELFVGNRLTKNEARIESGRIVDLKAIRAPIIVFASHGDNITPPQQALNWIVDTYADEREIRIRGQRIIYMVHDQVGHLGIFVSSQIANREHSEMANTMATIEALAPGLYEMHITNIQEQDGRKHFTVHFSERTLDDIRAMDDGITDESPFAAVARASEVQAQMYEALVRPSVKAMVNPVTAELSRAMHPQRLSRELLSSSNPAMKPVAEAAKQVRENRNKAASTNPFLTAESLCVQSAEQMLDFWRDTRDMAFELGFFGMWGTPWARAFGGTNEARRTLKQLDELRGLPEVTHALQAIDKGGFPEAVIRMLILMLDNRGQVRRDRLVRSLRVLSEDEPFSSLGAARRATIIHQQTLIATYEPERAFAALPALLADASERKLAMKVVQYISGALDDISPDLVALLERMRDVLGLETLDDFVQDDPLAPPFASVVPRPKRSAAIPAASRTPYKRPTSKRRSTSTR
jgi:pimeloyl-ACP methyl ester carboxylesterase